MATQIDNKLKRARDELREQVSGNDSKIVIKAKAIIESKAREGKIKIGFYLVMRFLYVVFYFYWLPFVIIIYNYLKVFAT